MRGFGLDPERLGDAVLSPDTVGFVEMHIEQGPVLDVEDLRVAAVTAVVGQTRLNLTFGGQANHAGTTPMPLRRDALAAAAEWISAVEALAQRTDGSGGHGGPGERGAQCGKCGAGHGAGEPGCSPCGGRAAHRRRGRAGGQGRCDCGQAARLTLGTY